MPENRVVSPESLAMLENCTTILTLSQFPTISISLVIYYSPREDDEYLIGLRNMGRNRRARGEGTSGRNGEMDVWLIVFLNAIYNLYPLSFFLLFFYSFFFC